MPQPIIFISALLPNLRYGPVSCSPVPKYTIVLSMHKPERAITIVIFQAKPAIIINFKLKHKRLSGFYLCLLKISAVITQQNNFVFIALDGKPYPARSLLVPVFLPGLSGEGEQLIVFSIFCSILFASYTELKLDRNDLGGTLKPHPVIFCASQTVSASMHETSSKKRLCMLFLK